MTRPFFLLALTGAVLTLASVRTGIARRAGLRADRMAGCCADHRRKPRWSSYTAADF